MTTVDLPESLQRAKPTAGWSLKSLMRQMVRRGWPTLRGRANSAALVTLEAIYKVCGLQGTDEWAGTATTTAFQLAEASGKSAKTMWRGLRELEDRGLISWHRGGVSHRAPRPSIIVLSRRALAALLATDGDGLEQRAAAHAIETATRLNALRTPHLNPPARRLAQFTARVSVSGHEAQPLPQEGVYQHTHPQNLPNDEQLWGDNPPPAAVAAAFTALRQTWTKDSSTKRRRLRGV